MKAGFPETARRSRVLTEVNLKTGQLGLTDNFRVARHSGWVVTGRTYRHASPVDAVCFTDHTAYRQNHPGNLNG